MSRDAITAGFMPLLDSAVLVAAREKGFAAAEDIDLGLVRESSWASIRDRIAVGHFDVAHMLAPMVIAANLGLTPIRLGLIAPFSLGLGGNAVCVSRKLWRLMKDRGATGPADPAGVGAALRRVIRSRAEPGAGKLRFAVVHPYSGHNFELRYWLSACGIDPEKDLDIVIVPPPLMPDALSAGRIDGYCVGEPWSSVAVARGDGCIAAVKAAIWRRSPEKALGVSAEWAGAHEELLGRLLRALHHSALWCAAPDNHRELAAILSESAYLAQPADILLRGLSGEIDTGSGTVRFEEFFLPGREAANFPWRSHALWFYAQMVRWGQVTHSPANAEAARLSFCPDLYRAALQPLGVSAPSFDTKREAGNEGFFDGIAFDPAELDAYIASQRRSLPKN